MGLGTNELKVEDSGNGESRTADRAIAAGFPKRASEQVLVQGKGAVKADDPAFVAAVDDTVRRLSAVRYVEELESPLAGGNEGQVSTDGRSALVTFELRGDNEQAEERVDAPLAAVAAAQRAHTDVRVEEFGDASASKELAKTQEKDFKKAEVLSLPITLLILIVAFGALVAAGLPLLLGMTAVIATLGLLGPVSQIFPADSNAASVVLLIGLAVGVDYSMFYVRRFMEEQDEGKGPDRALAVAAATSGRAVLISGVTVMVAMAGMLFAGSAGFTSIAVGAMLVVAVSVVGSLTVLPATLSWLGNKGWLEKGRVPWISKHRHETHDESRVWGMVIGGVLRRPALSVALAGGLLVALAIPAFGIHTVNSGFEGLPRSLSIVQTYDRIQAAFPGGPTPAVVAVEAPDVTADSVQNGIGRMRLVAVATGELSEPVTQTVNPDKTLALVNIPLAGDGTDKTSEAALVKLRNEVIPTTIGKVPGASVNVTGLTAGSFDFNEQQKSSLPLVFGFVFGLAFLLLLVTFRSIVVPIVAITLNLLSVGAAYGVLKLVFQDGNGEGLLNFHSIGGVVSWLPLFLFVVLFGLSMDYHVFVLTRIREGVDRGLSNNEAISHGIKSSAGVITSAAVVMIAIFAVFATLSAIDFKMMGVGLAVAVLIDATIVRAVLLPAVMTLLGDWNWYLPKWLDRMPTLEPEAGRVPTGAPVAPVA
jgi:RND superfamily putative drug exporter